MPETPTEGSAAADGKHSGVMPVRTALAIAVLFGSVAAAATVMVLRDSTGYGALLGVVALAAFGLTAYGLIQAVLAVVDTAGERRRLDREVTERRQGDRAREPRVLP